MNCKILIRIILILGITASALTSAHAVKARTTPTRYTQPDGSVIYVQRHGDEFLNWATVNGRLVELGEDGFYYYGEFNADGSVSISSVKAKGGSITPSTTRGVVPPASAIAAANIRRQASITRTSISRMSDSSHIMSFGNKRFLVLLIEFPDVKFTVPDPNRTFTRLLNEEGYSENDATGSARDYYIENSQGRFTPTFDVYGPIEVSYNHDAGFNDEVNLADYILVEACQKADSEIDFTQYDIDANGEVDMVFFFFAGENAAEGDRRAIYPHKWEIFRPQYSPFDGLMLRSYACTSEYATNTQGSYMAGIGTFCHEFAHVLGLYDLYDTNYETGGLAPALGTLCIMDDGSYNNDGHTPPYFNGYERYMMGWLDLTEWVNSGEKTLKTIQDNEAYITKTANEGEFYLYEYRDGNGYDKYIGAEGVAIYHIDQSNNLVNGRTAKSIWESGSGINDFSEHQCFDLVESHQPERQADVLGNKYKLFPGEPNNTEINATTTPDNKTWDGEDTGVSISNIQLNGTTASLSLITSGSGFVIEDFFELGINAIYKNKASYKAGDLFPFMLSVSNNEPESTEWYFDGQIQEGNEVELTAGEHTVEAHLTYSDGSTEKIVTTITVK
ncbi:MAG TPA: M6 family metalloprotease domain-containing protein [Candidatus Coprenecus stercoravium]|uniref:M6 family metalloprotease domain-containing protein n=1 Tax=Candidatus Coprenecus stercoravium TaxID=2840735 RepID=A0A9D2GQK1_9BACT|nr:M6 family metalloprotease domain-containing protein [Candidatus Coprenecus stercoravium]